MKSREELMQADIFELQTKNSELLLIVNKFLEIRGRIDVGIDIDYSEAFDMAERFCNGN